VPNPLLTTMTRRALLALACIGPPSARASYQLREWPMGQATPVLQLSDLDGKRWTLESWRGRAVLLNFWATWCEPCRAEMPSLQALARRREADGLTVVTVNYRETEPAIRRFLDAAHITLPVLLDRDGAAAQAWTPRIFPSTVLIDRSGRPRRVVVGEVDWAGDEARRWMDDLLKHGSRAG
jgi:thiol-disulfide isomerase/thioredoxin